MNRKLVSSQLMADKTKPRLEPIPPRNAWMLSPRSKSLALQMSKRYARIGLSHESAEKSSKVTPIPTSTIAMYGFYSH